MRRRTPKARLKAGIRRLSKYGATRYLAAFALLTVGAAKGSGAATSDEGATSFEASPALILVVILVAVVTIAVYLGACYIWPFEACPKCDGSGRYRSPTGKAWRPCKRCAGKGARIRRGRRVINKLLDLRDVS